MPGIEPIRRRRELPLPVAARKQDKRIVEEFDSVRDIWWGKVNIKLEEARIRMQVRFELWPVIA